MNKIILALLASAAISSAAFAETPAAREMHGYDFVSQMSNPQEAEKAMNPEPAAEQMKPAPAKSKMMHKKGKKAKTAPAKKHHGKHHHKKAAAKTAPAKVQPAAQ